MLFPTLVGLAVFFGAVWWALTTHAHLWRLVALSYRTDKATLALGRLARKSPEQAILAKGALSYRNYVPLTISIHEGGISLALYPPFSALCPPLLLPFSDMSVRSTSWYLNAQCYAIRMARAGDVDIIIDDRLLRAN